MCDRNYTKYVSAYKYNKKQHLFLILGCFDLLLDAEKCKFGIEMSSTMGTGLMGGSGMFFGSGATPSTMSPSQTPSWSNTPQHPDWSPSGQSKKRNKINTYIQIYTTFNLESLQLVE